MGQIGVYFLGMFFGILIGLSVPSSPSEVVTLKDGTYHVVATGKEVRLLEKRKHVYILRGEEAEKLPESGTFTQETVRKDETTITQSK